MPYRWNKNTIDAESIVESREFDQAHAEFTSLINGGMDRENLPEECIMRDSMVKNSFGRAVIKGDIYAPFEQLSQDSYYGAPYSNTNTKGNRITGLTYGTTPINEGDQFYEIASQDIQCEEGMIFIGWKCSAFMPMYHANFLLKTSSSEVARHWYQYSFSINGIQLYMTPAICQTFFTTDIGFMVPVGKGTQTVKVSMKYPIRKDETDNQVLVNYWGGQLFLHNTYR